MLSVAPSAWPSPSLLWADSCCSWLANSTLRVATNARWDIMRGSSYASFFSAPRRSPMTQAVRSGIVVLRDRGHVRPPMEPRVGPHRPKARAAHRCRGALRVYAALWALKDVHGARPQVSAALLPLAAFSSRNGREGR